MPDGDALPDYDSRPEAIRRTIEARIIDGKMRPGDRLGLKADLQKEFDVAGPTIAQALTQRIWQSIRDEAYRATVE